MPWVYEVQSYYPGYGWECVTAEDTREGANDRLREYRENEPHIPHRVKVVREENV